MTKPREARGAVRNLSEIWCESPCAHWPHICPYVTDIRQAFIQASCFGHCFPSQRKLADGWPDRILFFSVSNYHVSQVIFRSFVVHSPSSSFGESLLSVITRPGVW